MKIIFVRHAHTEYNVKGPKGRFCGISDPGITERGIAESIRVANFLKKKYNIAVIVSSGLRRSHETAKIIAELNQMQIQIDERFKELNYGIWDGLTKGEILGKYEKDLTNFDIDPIKFFPLKGDDPNTRVEEAHTALQEYKNDMIIVSHKAIIRLLICKIKGIDLNQYRNICDLKLGSITEIGKKGTDLHVRSINSINHLA